MSAVPATPTTWTTGTTEVFKTGTWRALLPEYVARPSPCQQACPVNGDIAEWIGHARAGDLRRAWEVLVEHNPFPAIAGRICHHPCESACNRAGWDAAVSVCRLERAAGDAAIAAGWALPAAREERAGHVAIVGGGPSGLSAAYQLRRRGWRVSLYESRPRLGGLMRYGIPGYRLARDVLDAEIDRIVTLGVQVHCDAPLSAGDLERLRATHDAVYLATGAAQPKVLPQLPAAPWLLQGGDYLAALAEGEVPRVGARVLVVGGGSAAMDVARSARRAGCEVTIVSLEPRERMPAQHEEVQEALEEGIVLHDGAMVLGADCGAADVQLECVRVCFEAGAPPRVTPLPGSAFMLAVDAVLQAIGQEADLALFPGLAAQRGVLAVDAGQATAATGVWAGGDLASRARFVTQAVGMGKRAALDIDRALRGLPRSEAHTPAAATLEQIATWYHPHARRAPTQRLPVQERLAGSAEVQLPLTAEQVHAEAQRCFSCGTCTHCDNCFQHCPDLAITHVDGGYAVLADYCKGCGICVRECPTGSMLLREELR
jgi:NADPH-dependent glutamate synthase beta subunit-like oxidoreductase